MSSVSEAQKMIFQDMNAAISSFVDSNSRNAFANEKKEGKDRLHHAQGIKWELRRIARMAYAIEVLESINPHYR